MRRFLIGVIGLGVSGCGILAPDSTSQREFQVAAFKAMCTGEAQSLCLQVREPGEQTYRHLFESPIGFQFEWGFEYVIVVEEKERDEPIADASSIVRRLTRQHSRAPVAEGTTFELLVASRWLEAATDTTVAVAHESLDLLCTDGACEAFLDSTQLTPRTLLTLSFRSSPGAPLQILAWQGCAEALGPCTAQQQR